jgi:hypothetical protein
MTMSSTRVQPSSLDAPRGPMLTSFGPSLRDAATDYERSIGQ